MCGETFEPPVKHRGRNTICSKECCEKFKKQCIEKEKISIQQIDINGEIVATYTGLNELCKYNGWYATNISKCLKGKIKTAYGYKWKYI